MQRREGHFRGYDKIELFYQTWEPENSCGTIVVTHGLAEHSECYQRLADGLTAFGWTVYAWDMRGHGRSDGKRGAVKEFSEYSRDLKCFVEEVKKATKGSPLFLTGHSMGGLVTIRTIIDFGDMGVHAATFSSPLLGIAVQVPPAKDMVARFLNRWVPGFTMSNEIFYEQLTRDESVYKTYDSDPLRHDRISLALYLGILDSCDYAMLNASKIKLPIFMQLAGNDLITNRKSSERFFERLGSQRKDLKVYKDYLHEIFNEIGRDIVYNDLNNFLKGMLEKK